VKRMLGYNAAAMAAMTMAAVIALEALAHAQSRRYPPEPVDVDRAAEQHSELWEEALHPNRDRYRARVERAKDFLRRRDVQAWMEAQDLLEGAVVLAPDEPLAHWMLAMLHEHREDWQGCAASYGEVLAIEPKYQPPPGETVPQGRKLPWALDAGLATCQAHTGAFEQAIASYQRVLGRGITEEADIHLGLGEAYMALGRLAEAIDALHIALKLQPDSRRASYALAVAYDRDEREAQARETMFTALRHDPGLDWLAGLAGQFVPATDEFYYLGLGRAARHETAWAIVYFRQYLHVTGSGPWTRRARHHLADLGREPMLHAGSIAISGTETMDRQVALAAIAPAWGELLACVKPVPGLLLELTVTSMGKPAGRSSRRDTRRAPALHASTPDTPGVKARILHSFATEPEQAALAQQCAESAAHGIAIPHPQGDAGRYVSVSVPLIAPSGEEAERGSGSQPGVQAN
jgi:tetratricopeptide (TPR) repeat protein